VFRDRILEVEDDVFDLIYVRGALFERELIVFPEVNGVSVTPGEVLSLLQR